MSLTALQAKDIYNQARTNIILISVVCMMIIGNTPVTLSMTEFAEVLFGLKGCQLLGTRSYRIFRAIANNLAQIAFSSNFFIYYAMNRNFQEWIRQVVNKCRCSQERETKINPQTLANGKTKVVEVHPVSPTASNLDI